MVVNISQFALHMLSSMNFITTPVENENVEAQTQEKVVKRGKEWVLLKLRKFFLLWCADFPLDHAWLQDGRRSLGVRYWSSVKKAKNTQDKPGSHAVGDRFDEQVTSRMTMVDFGGSWASYLGKLFAAVFSSVKRSSQQHPTYNNVALCELEQCLQRKKVLRKNVLVRFLSCRNTAEERGRAIWLFFSPFRSFPFLSLEKIRKADGKARV